MHAETQKGAGLFLCGPNNRAASGKVHGEKDTLHLAEEVPR